MSTAIPDKQMVELGYQRHFDVTNLKTKSSVLVEKWWLNG